ncbi:putative NRPS-like enzyme [Xylaria intraflava]|nr:putative NRPS-like enzyme [Xylaria intraflava]
MATDNVSRRSWRERSIPQVVDQLASENPDAVYGIWPVQPDSYSAGVRTITYGQLANIVNGLAWWLVKQLGPSQKEVLTYVGPNDVRFTALTLAAFKTGYAIFATSPRNSPEAHRKLFERLECDTLVASNPEQQPALGVRDAVKPRRVMTIPGVDELLSTTYPQYDMTRSFEESLSDAFWIIHTSGSTGIPKPLIWSQETLIRSIETSQRDAPNGEVSLDAFMRGKRILNTLPPFHGAGLCQYFIHTIPSGVIPIVPATPGAIATAQSVVDALKKTPADMAIMVPSVVAELSQNPKLLDYCARHLQLITYIGGDLPQAVGDRVAAKVPLRCWWGASEVSIPHQFLICGLEREPGGWRYVRFHPNTGTVFDEMENGLYELVVRPKTDRPHTDPQPPFTIRGFEDLPEYRTHDLFEPHPRVPDAWRWCARADDIIVFLNGEKTNPISMEQYVTAKNQDVIGSALVIGAQRFQAGLIIEPLSRVPLTIIEQAALIERVWPSVEEANRIAPSHARIEKSLILVAGSKRFIRAGKGTVQRPSTIAQYTAEIENMYANADVSTSTFEDGEAVDESGLAALTNVNAIKQLIRRTVRSITGWSEMNDNDSFFDSGMDSLQALRLVRTMRKALFRPNLSLSTVYQNPTTLQLASAVLSSSQEASDDGSVAGQFLKTYRRLIQQIPKTTTPLPSQTDKKEGGRYDVLLTGSTGTLGTSILVALLRRPDVGHLFCLNRGADGGHAAQYERFTAQKLETGTLSDRVTFLKADFVDPKFGLDSETYDMLQARVGLLIHNAWPVNFNLPLLAFRPQLAGLVNIFSFAAPRSIRTVFVSSVGAVIGTGPSPPEEVLPEETVLVNSPVANGYSRSKLIAEFLCDSAARHLDLSVTVLRYGQIGGSTAEHGAVWNRSEWLPSLATSSLLRLNGIPDNLGPHFSEVDWVPSDMAGAIVADLVQVTTTPDTAHNPSPRGAKVLNVRNPKTTSWSSLIPAIQSAAQANLGYAIEVVTPTAWLARLQQSEKDEDEEKLAGNTHSTTSAEKVILTNPAVKLLDFYREILWPQQPNENAASPQEPVVVEHAVAMSATLRDMAPVNAAWMRKWALEWIADAGPATMKQL